MLILDEPTMGQDWRHLSGFMDFLSQLNARGMTILLITHDYKLICRYAQCIVVLQNGRIVADGSPRLLRLARFWLLIALALFLSPFGDACTAMRLRGGFWRERFAALKKLLVTVVAGSLRRGEEIVDAAEARAFDPARAQGRPARPTRADLLLAFAVLCCGLAILLPRF